jgi:two-component system chemotaxis response regulator CheY
MAKILFVEDDHSLRQIATLALTRAGHDVVTATDARNAFIHLLQNQFDAMVVDVGLPDMDGLAITRSLRAAEKFEDLPILAATGYTGHVHVAEMMEAGMDGVIDKPYRPKELVSAVDHLLKICYEAA